MNGTPVNAPASLNLARRPFVNTRPVGRVALLLWGLGALLLAANATLYWGYFAGSEDTAARLEQIEQQIAGERERLAELERELAGIDLASQNEQVEFLNTKIAERAFSWSLLFDRLAEVLPADVRLLRLAPTTPNERQRGGGGGTVRQGRRAGAGPSTGGERVLLVISGIAREEDALYQFVDNLFAHPAFGDPNFSRESREDDQLQFDIQVSYLPGGLDVPGPVVVEEPPAAAPGAAGTTGAAAASSGTSGRLP